MWTSCGRNLFSPISSLLFFSCSSFDFSINHSSMISPNLIPSLMHTVFFYISLHLVLFQPAFTSLLFPYVCQSLLEKAMWFRGLRDRWWRFGCVSTAGQAVRKASCWGGKLNVLRNESCCLSCVCYSGCVSCSCEGRTPCCVCFSLTHCWKEHLGLASGQMEMQMVIVKRTSSPQITQKHVKTYI